MDYYCKQASKDESPTALLAAHPPISTSWQILRNFVQLFTLPMNANAMVLEHAKGLRRFHSRQGSDEGEGVPSAAGKARS